MRPCPVCGNTECKDLGFYEPGYFYHLYACPCGMRYLDDERKTQAYYDEYYKFDTSPDLGTTEDIARLKALAAALPEGRGLDVGGKWSYLKDIHQHDTLNAGEAIEGEYDYVILSHTLEHVYDVQGLMQKIYEHTLIGGKIIIEGPIWLSYNSVTYDHNWQHLNKFTPASLEELLSRWFYRVETSERLPDLSEFNCWRVIGGKL